jgi:hypothetical protein
MDFQLLIPARIKIVIKTGTTNKVLIESKTAAWFGLSLDAYEKKKLHGQEYVVLGSVAHLQPPITVPHLPKVIRMNLDQIEPILGSENYHKRIVSLPFVKSDNFYKLFKGHEYFKLANEVISKFSVSFTDEKNFQLNLGVGQPTVVVLNLRPTPKMDTFPLMISAHDSNAVFPENTNASFKVRLPHPVAFEGTWLMAIASATLETSINLKNFVFPASVTLLFHGDSDAVSYPLEERDVYEIRDVLDSLNETIKKATIPTNAIVEFHSYSASSIAKIGVSSTHAVSIKFSQNLNQIFNNVRTSVSAGLTRDDRTKSVFVGKDNLMTVRPKVAMIYSNISSPIIVGDQQLNLIKVLPLTDDDKFFNYYESTQMNYVNVASSEITVIELSIRDVGGLPIDFKNIIPNSFNFTFRRIK